METPPLYGDKDAKAINKMVLEIVRKTGIDYDRAVTIAMWEMKYRKKYVNAMAGAVISDPLMIRRFYLDIAKMIEEQYEIDVLEHSNKWLPCLIRSVLMYVMKYDYFCHEEWVAIAAQCSRTTVIRSYKRVEDMLLYDVDDSSKHFRYWYRIITMIAENKWRYLDECSRAEDVREAAEDVPDEGRDVRIHQNGL